MNGDGISEKKFITHLSIQLLCFEIKNKYLDVKEGLSGIKKNFH